MKKSKENQTQPNQMRYTDIERQGDQGLPQINEPSQINQRLRLKSEALLRENPERLQKNHWKRELSSVILCGGKSRRMGEDKAGLSFAGETFLTHILSGLLELDEVLISVGAAGLSKKARQSLDALAASGRIQLLGRSFGQNIPSPGSEVSEKMQALVQNSEYCIPSPKHRTTGCEAESSQCLTGCCTPSPKHRTVGEVQPQRVRFVQDEFPDCGPMAGLHAALRQCRHQLLFTVSCDMPYASAQTARQLLGYMTGEIDAVVPRAADGRLHPLCALYQKSCADVLYEALTTGEYRMRKLLEKLRVCYVPLEAVPALSRWVCNVNTREAYQEIISMEKIR